MMYEVSSRQTDRIVIACDSTSGEIAARGMYTLLHCPPVPAGNFVLARRHDDGRSVVLAMGRMHSNCMSSNLAQLRRLGAELGANEVHLLPA